MRCEDLTRELASPTGVPTPAEMAGHLAACPACVEWSRRAAYLDRIWAATRPADPSSMALEALWARASAEIDARQASPATLRFVAPPRSRGRRVMIGLAIAAQAAALLAAALFLLRRDGAGPVQVASIEPILLQLNVEDDQVATFRIGERHQAPKVDLQDLSRLFTSPTLPPFTPHDEFDEMEAEGASLDIVASTLK